MRSLLVLLLLGTCALAASDGKSVSQKQKDVLLLMSHINQEYMYPDWKNIIESYNVSQHSSQYSKPEVVQDFEMYYPHDYLPKEHIFSIMYSEHLHEAIVLFKLFYYATTYETFYNTAVWARYHLNEGLFLYAYSVAVIHRPDMKGAVLPPIYEIYPHYFYDTSAIHKAYYYKQVHSTQHPHSGYNPQHGYTVHGNYSGYYLNLHPEQTAMSDYLEDVGINAYYYYYNLHYPFWMKSSEYGFANVHRGIQYFYFYQQLLAKYYSERISYGLGEIPFINLELPVETPYYPSLEYPQGLEFPYRPPFAKLQEVYYNYGQQWSFKGIYGYSYELVKTLAQRLHNLIDRGYVYVHDQKINLYTPEGLNILGNIIESNPDSPDHKFYGYLWLYARHLLGYSYQPLHYDLVIPSALEHFETSLRDPMFYQLYKIIWTGFYMYLYQQKPYTVHDLVYPGVEITHVEVDKLVTYDELVYSDLSNAVFLSEEELLDDSFHIRVAQEKLNHKPFNYKITVKSEHDAKSVVKIFLAPMYDEYHRYINISENQVNMVLLDYFVYSLKTGENVIARSSQDSHLYAPDLLSYHELYTQYASAQHSKGESPTIQNPNYYAFPHRHMLPHGSEAGTPYLLYVFIYPYVQSPQSYTGDVYSNYFYPYEGHAQFYDNYSLPYPFDKPIIHEHIWLDSIPNSYMYEAKVYHLPGNVNVVH